MLVTGSSVGHCELAGNAFEATCPEMKVSSGIKLEDQSLVHY